MRRRLLGSALMLVSCGTPIAICGDSKLSAGEACDDGNNIDADGCRADCFGKELCGDFLLDQGEVCDDGNQDDGDGCTADCSRREICGDAILDSGEECDDGNNIDADGCEANCLRPACNNKIIDPGELCTGFANDTRVDALPFALALADVNNDGLLDLISANAGRSSPASATDDGLSLFHETPVLEGTVSVLFGAGNGTFTGRVDYRVHRSPLAILTADLNNDGAIDISVVNSGSDSLSTLLNNGDGTFAPELENDTGDQPAALTAFDRDNDGDLDLATTDTTTGQVSVFLNQGASFLLGETIPQSGFPRSIASQDIDQDGKGDLVVARLNNQRLSVLLQRGATWEERVLDAPGFPIEVKLADLDKDTHQDIAVTYSSTQEVGVFFGDGAGNFPEERRFATGENPSQLELGDVNNDALLDIVVLNKGDNNVSILLSEDNRSFAPERRVQDLVLFSSLALGDINDDGRLDLSLGVNLSSFARVFFGDGDGAFRKNPSFLTANTPLKLSAFAFDADELPDVAALTSQGVSIFPNLGDARLGAEITLGIPNATAITSYQSGTEALAIISSDGQLTRVIQGAPLTIDIGGAPSQIAAGALIGGPEQDLFLFDTASSSLRIFEQLSDTSFAEGAPILVGEDVVGLSAGDVDGDGSEDIIALTASAAKIYFSDGAGAFTEQSISLSAPPTAHLLLSGALYVASTDLLSVITQPQPRQFVTQEAAMSGAWSSIAAADINVDGELDLVISDARADEIIALDTTSLTLLQRLQAKTPTGLILVDLSGDALDDLLVAEPLEQRFRAFFSNP